MKCTARLVSLTVLSLVVFASPAYASPADLPSVDGALRVFRAENPSARILRVAGNPVPHGIFDIRIKSGALSPETAARAFISKHAGIWTLEANGVTLETSRVIRTGFGHVVQFRPRYRGLDVVGGTLSVGLDRANNVISVTTGLRPLTEIDVRPGLNEFDAWRQALSFVDWTDRPVVKKFDPRGAKLVVFVTGGGPALAYEVSVSQPANMHRWKVYVDAGDGKFLFKRPNVVFLNQAKVYDPNPGFAMDAPLSDVTLGDFADNDHTIDKTLNGVRIITKNCAGSGAPKDLFEFDGTLYRGPLCEMVFKTQADGNGDFLAQPLDPAECVNLAQTGTQEELDACFEKNAYDEYAEVAMYYHANKVYDYFRGMGFSELVVSPIVAGVNLKIPNMYDLFYGGATCEPGKDEFGNDITICTTTRFMPFDNAMFMPFDPNDPSAQQYGEFFGVDQDAILFGQGAFIDFAYDGDVIYHEFTHAVIQTVTDNQMVDFDEYGMVIEVGAVNEGMADYFAAALTDDPKTGNYARRADPSGDSLTMSPDSIRDIGVQVRCLDDTWGEVHQDGLVISNAVWEARKLFSETFPAKDVQVFHKAVFDSMASWGPVPRFKTVTEAILSSFSNNPEIGADFAAAARPKFEANNAHDCPRVFKLELGRSKDILFSDNYGSLNFWPGYFQFSFDVPEGATTLYMGFDAQSSGYGGTTDIRVVFRKDEHVIINWDLFMGNNSFVADKEVERGEDGYYTIRIPDLEPGKTYFMALLNYGDSAFLQGIFANFTNDPVEIDAGIPDGGTDGGPVTLDGGQDVGTAEDAGDSGEPDDAGVGPDTAARPDTGTPDAGVAPDAGPAPDAGGAGGVDGAAETDAAEEGADKAAGCSCATLAVE
ncbi:MAG: hypothetical protein HY897_19945 [Deltaproteobacteria bacterium]|nr:hypothetical protein [Deltaproteobacteria bacterium]